MPLPERFAKVHDLVGQRRDEVHGEGPMAAVATVANLMPTALVIAMTRNQASHIDFATSNLPGYRGEPWIAGARLLHTYAFGPVAGTAFNLTAVSTGPVLDIGLHTDAAAIAEPALLARCMDEAYTDLLALGGTRTHRSRSPR
jgi:hypothetical protein